jgi:NAD(P)-dependent dehydrogenase (short-subunit alcohol dehydrogenase family)
MSTAEIDGALVIGGASGIGAAVVDLYRSRGVPTMVWDMAAPSDVRCDIAEADQIDRALRETTEEFGLPRWVTITAGVGHSGLLTGTSAAEWDRVMQVNARGPWLCMRALAQAMVEAGQSGSMVATSSVSAHLVDRSMGAYCASKAALNMTVQVAAHEWGPSGIRVNAIAPGVTRTPMLGQAPDDSPWLTGVRARTPLGRLGQPEDMAQAVIALHEMEWVTGQILDCDGGLSLYSPIDSYGEVLRHRSRRPAD